MSFTIGLNERDEYRGGGTWFADAEECAGAGLEQARGGAIAHTECGHATLFAGGCLTHAGEPITAGRRYVAVVFLYADGFIWPGGGADENP